LEYSLVLKPSITVEGVARKLLADNLRAFRRTRGWSQELLAFEAGLDRTFIAHVEREARNISLDNVEKLANALSVQVHELLIPPSLPKMDINSQ
jgi:transcriptional regulator with XRE-family HTH domain